MRPLTGAALVLLALGIVAFAHEGISYMTRGNTVDLGPLYVTAGQSQGIPLLPVIGGIVLEGGIVLLFVERGRARSAAAQRAGSAPDRHAFPRLPQPRRSGVAPCPDRSQPYGLSHKTTYSGDGSQRERLHRLPT